MSQWLEKAQAKRTEGLGYVHSKDKGKKKKYVDLPSQKLCNFCGKIGHLERTCIRKLRGDEMNFKYVWKKKSDDTSTSKEPKDDWVPPSDE